MNRKVFIVSTLVVYIAAVILMKLDFENVLLGAFLLSCVLVFLRRKYLGLKPWWGGKLKEIKSLFQNP